MVTTLQQRAPPHNQDRIRRRAGHPFGRLGAGREGGRAAGSVVHAGGPAAGAPAEATAWRLLRPLGELDPKQSLGLSDLGLHHPPCRELARNKGFYAVGARAWLLGTATDALGGVGEDRGRLARKDGGERARATPRRLRLWRLRRELFTLPGRVARPAPGLKAHLPGPAGEARQFFERFWGNPGRCRGDRRTRRLQRRRPRSGGTEGKDMAKTG